MRPKEMIIRCYAEKQDELWVAVCVDFALAAQDSSYEGARQKLHTQISEYVYDALVGEDREHAEMLLSRKSPLRYRARYYLLWRLSQLNLLGHHMLKKFKEVFPMVPVDPYGSRQPC